MKKVSRFAAAVVLFLAGHALAETRWSLTWSAPSACIGPVELAQVAEEAIGRSVFGPNPDLRIEGKMEEGSQPRWRARFAILGVGGEVLGAREVTSDDGSCRALDRKLALAVAGLVMSERREPTRADAPSRGNAEADVAGGVVGGVAAPDSESVLVHIDADEREVRLLRHLGTSTGYGYTTGGSVSVTTVHYSDECRAPCDRLVPRSDQRFWIGGQGVAPSESFVLSDHAKRGQVTMKVRAGSATAQFLGWTGAGLFGAGGVGTGIALIATSGPKDLGYGIRVREDNPEQAVAGAVLLGAGVAAAVVCIIVAVNNATTVTFEDAK